MLRFGPWASSVGSPTEPFDLSGYDFSHFQTGSYSWPSPPVTTSVENVTTIGEFQSAVSMSDVLINVAAGTYTGDINITGSNVDIVMSNSATLNGLAYSSQGYGGPWSSHIRWTGGNIDMGTGSLAAGSTAWLGVEDVLFQDIDWLGNMFLERDFDTQTRTPKRIAFVEVTMDNRNISASGDFTFFNSPSATSGEDLIFANSKFYNKNNNCLRIQRFDRAIFVECATNIGDDGVGGFRFSNGCKDALVAGKASKPCIIVGLIHLENASEDYCIIDSLWDNIDRYDTSNRQFALQGAKNNTGTVSNIEFNSDLSPAAVGGISPLTTGENVPDTISWDGSTYPDVSSYGAQR